jgi:hypothetical protein
MLMQIMMLAKQFCSIAVFQKDAVTQAPSQSLPPGHLHIAGF